MLAKLKQTYQSLDNGSGGRLGIVKYAIETYTKKRASADAASLAYYTIFSLFPLLLVITAIGSFFLNSASFYDYLLRVVKIALPVSTELVTENLNHLIAARGPVGLIGLLTLLWSASGMFSGLATAISRAWPAKSRRNVVQVRLIGIAIVVGLSAILVASLTIIGILKVTPLLDRENGSVFTQDLWNAITGAGSWASMLFLFMVLYRWIPNTNVPWMATMWGAIFTTCAWKIAIWGFTWYVTSGIGQYQLVYGTLGAIVALLFLIFILSNIMLFGAHLSAAIDHWDDERKKRVKATLTENS